MSDQPTLEQRQAVGEAIANGGTPADVIAQAEDGALTGDPFEIDRTAALDAAIEAEAETLRQVKNEDVPRRARRVSQLLDTQVDLIEKRARTGPLSRSDILRLQTIEKVDQRIMRLNPRRPLGPRPKEPPHHTAQNLSGLLD